MSSLIVRRADEFFPFLIDRHTDNFSPIDPHVYDNTILLLSHLMFQSTCFSTDGGFNQLRCHLLQILFPLVYMPYFYLFLSSHCLFFNEYPFSIFLLSPPDLSTSGENFTVKTTSIINAIQVKEKKTTCCFKGDNLQICIG